MNFTEAANAYETPLYLYDFDGVTKRYTELKSAFRARKSIMAFAVKSNSNLSTLSHMAKLGSGADCVSIGEVRRALKAGIPKYQIIFSGVGKKDSEIKEALESDILFINLESEAEMKRVEMIAKEIGKTARISIRVNPNIDPKTHPYISTGLHENKFGVDLDSAKRMYLKAKNSENLDPVGIHFHIGSQLTELEPIRESAIIVADLVRTLEAVGIELTFFDVGGGLGVVYDDEVTIDPVDYAQAILSTMTGLDMTIICEPGRYLMANNGYFLTKVLYEKINGDRRFVVVDGAMNDLLRPSLYNAYHKVEVVTDKGDAEKTLADVVGPVCESGDFLTKQMELPLLEHNDLLVVHSAGAYGFTMASNYNTRGRAAEVAVIDGEMKLIRRRETFDDLIANEVEFLDS
jgi:diaminopimelate decarboxylase